MSVSVCADCDRVVAAEDQAAHVESHRLGDAELATCVVCSRSPAMPLTLQFHSGYLLVHRTRSAAAPVCRICAQGAFRTAQAHNVVRGPWGLTSLVHTFTGLVANRAAYRHHQQLLEPPTPDSAAADEKRRGKPVLRRPSVIGALALFLAAVLFVGAAFAKGGLGGPDMTVGDCVELSGDIGFKTSDCDTADGIVVAVVSHPYACSSDVPLYLELGTEEFACVGYQWSG